ncbi:hypothetical protein MHTCC0001_00570 [Flavobacteriaceae bacterium MHTCC 0001]
MDVELIFSEKIKKTKNTTIDLDPIKYKYPKKMFLVIYLARNIV